MCRLLVIVISLHFVSHFLFFPLHFTFFSFCFLLSFHFEFDNHLRLLLKKSLAVAKCGKFERNWLNFGKFMKKERREEEEKTSDKTGQETLKKVSKKEKKFAKF